MADITALLQQLGFSEYEARAYLALLQRNPLNGYELAKVSGLPRANVYAVLQKLESFATERGHSMLELAIGWLASQPSVSSVIAGATKPEQIEQNAAAGAWKLTPEELAEVDRIAPKPA